MATGGGHRWCAVPAYGNTTETQEYIENNRSSYTDDNRGSLPPVTDPDEPLQLDSLGLIRLVAFLENDLGYRVEDEELIADNFATLRQIGQLLATKTLTGPTGETKLDEQQAVIVTMLPP